MGGIYSVSVGVALAQLDLVIEPRSILACKIEARVGGLLVLTLGTRYLRDARMSTL